MSLVVAALGDRLLAAKAIQHDADLRLCWCCIEFGFITIDLNQTYVRFHILGISAWCASVTMIMMGVQRCVWGRSMFSKLMPSAEVAQTLFEQAPVAMVMIDGSRL